MFFIATLDIIPAGLIAARIQGTSLRDAVNESSAPSNPEEAPLS
jgi:hypothetical protein